MRTTNNPRTMMYLTGIVVNVNDRWICYIRTPRLHVMKSSARSIMEAISEALKIIGLPK